MDGSMSAGLSDYLTYSEKSKYQTVETVSFADACAELGEVPGYVKMDIEGAEVVTLGKLARISEDASGQFCHRELSPGRWRADLEAFGEAVFRDRIRGLVVG